MNKKSISHFGKADRALKILKYLKENTDAENTLSQKDIRAVPGMEKYVGDKHFFHDLILELAISLDYDEEGHKKPKEQCRLVFDGLDKMPYDIFDFIDNPDAFSIRTSHIYYNHPFSSGETDFIIEALKRMDYTMPGECESLVEKVKSELASSHFTQKPDSLPIIHEFNRNDKNYALNNLKIIGQAIRDKVVISYKKCRYDHDNVLTPCSDTIVMSPYYIVSYGGKYYVWGAVGKSHKIHIVRADLITGVTIPGLNTDTGAKGVKAEPKYLLEKRYRKWDDKLMLRHAGMSEDYSGGTYISVHCPKEKGMPLARINEDYTFLHDIFGDGFYFRGMDFNDIDHDVFHIDGDVFSVIAEYSRIKDIVSSKSPYEMETVLSASWTGWLDWYGYGGQDYSSRFGILTEEKKKKRAKRKKYAKRRGR